MRSIFSSGATDGAVALLLASLVDRGSDSSSSTTGTNVGEDDFVLRVK